MDMTDEKILAELEEESQKRFPENFSNKTRKSGPIKREIEFSKEGDESPFEEISLGAGQAKAANIFGACSLEKFCHAGSLSKTHEDADGWLNFLKKWYTPNYWYQDSGVRCWFYYDTYDNWQDTYGIDAVLAFYHSGHGGMDGNGVFCVPLGADWGDCDCIACSDKMVLADEKVRYIFWSTCVSLRVFDGQNPIKTWGKANRGFRMMFGFETTSWDDPNYGAYFWDQWSKGDSFSTAWLNASWRIAHDMAPTAVACGATKDEAINRLNNERILYWDRVNTNWWWWRWYYPASGASASRDANRKLPKEFLTGQLRPVDVSKEYVVSVMDRIGTKLDLPGDLSAVKGKAFYMKKGEEKLAFGSDGSFEVQIGKPNRANVKQISLGKARSTAQDAIKSYGLDQNVSLTFDRIRLESEAGCRADETGRIDGPYSIQTTVQYRQVINGLPVITPGAGTVRISIDNDGSVTSIQSSIRKIAQLTDQSRVTTAMPLEEGSKEAQPTKMDEARIEQLLANKWQEQMLSWVVGGKLPLQYTIVPGSTEIGYDIRNNEAILVAQRAMEVDFGNGYLKRYWVTVPILG